MSRIVKTPNLARARSMDLRGPRCVAECKTGQCPNGARWSLITDAGVLVVVCRLHANKAERAGELEVRTP